MNVPLKSYRIGIDASCLHRYHVGGMETYINNLILELQRLNHPRLEFVRLEGPPSLKRPSRFGPVNFLREIGWLHLGISVAARQERLDLLHMPAHLHAPWCRTPQIATLHDAHVYIAPGTHPFLVGLYIKFFTWLAGKTTNVSLIVTPSENAKKDLMKYHHIPAEKIAVTHLGSRRFPPITNPHPHPNWKPYLFYLGVMKPHKNLLRLLETYQRLIAFPEFSAYHLVLGGPYFGADYEILKTRIVSFNLQDRVHLIGPQTNEQLSHWYSQAEVAVLPSINEGFGHMPLEAMQFATPVVVSRVGAIPEIVGDAAEFIENPTSVDDIFHALHHVLSNATRREELRRLGKLRVEEFTWRKHAERMIQVYLQTLQRLYHDETLTT